MNQRAKTVLALTAFLVSVVGIGAALYFVFLRNVVEPIPPTTLPPEGVGSLPASGVAGERPPQGPLPGSTGAGALPGADTIARGGVTKVQSVTPGSAAHGVPSGNGLNYYDPKDGKFYSVDANGNVVALSDTRFPQADAVSWNKEADKAVIEFPDGSNVVYDFATQNQVTLPSHWEELQFSPTTDEIIAESNTLDPDNRSIVITNSDGSNVKSIQALGANADKVQMSWSPNDQVVAFSDTADAISGGFDRKMILPIGKNHENFRGLTVEGLDFTPNWAPDGKKLLYSASGAYSNFQPMLWITDGTAATMGNNRKSLGVNTWADKCAFASSSVAFCAVPQFLPEGAGLQRAIAANVPDTLYRVDLAAGRVTVVAIPETPVTMEQVEVSADGSEFFFRNPATAVIEKIQLK